jgi:predicted dehydrogenase
VAADRASLMVGFNRRFAPLVRELRASFAGVESRAIAIRVNAGPLPAAHWLNDPLEGGGRFLGEGCHFVDLLAHLADSEIASIYAVAVPEPNVPVECAQQVTVVARCRNGCTGTIVYTGDGDARLPKERVEMFGGGTAAVVDDFRRLEIFGSAARVIRDRKQNKGHLDEIASFVAMLKRQAEPPDVRSYIASTVATLAAAESLRTGEPVELE